VETNRLPQRLRVFQKVQFHSYRLDLPTPLKPGRYRLRLNLIDELSGDSATIELPFVSL